MRILYVTQVPLDGNNGAAQHVRGVTRALAALGHAVDLVAAGAQRETSRQRRTSARPGAWLEIVQSRTVAGRLSRERPDLAYVRICASTSLVPWVLARHRVPTFFELNGPILDQLAARGRGPLVRALVRSQLRRALRGAVALVVPHQPFAAHARELLAASNVEVIENGCDLEVAVPGPRHDARRELDLPLDRRCVAFIGTLGPDQRLDLLPAVAAMPGVMLLVAGEGQDGRRIVDATRSSGPDALRFFGPVAHQRAMAIARAADVCLELCPRNPGGKCLEYAALGRRMVAFEAPGIERLRSLYPGREVVFGLRDGSVSELHAALRAALDAESRDPLPAAAIESARGKLGWDTTARRIAALLDRRLGISEAPVDGNRGPATGRS